MPNSITVSNTFNAATKARSAEVNQNFTDLVNAFNGGNRDPYFGTIALKTSFQGNENGGSFSFGNTDSIFHVHFSLTGSTDCGVILPASTANVNRIAVVSRMFGTGNVTVQASGESLLGPIGATTTIAHTLRSGDAAIYQARGDTAGGTGWMQIASNFRHRVGDVSWLTAAAAGEIGETISVDLTTTQSFTTSGVGDIDVTNAILSLTVGHWEISYAAILGIANLSGGSRALGLGLRVTDSSNNDLTGSASMVFYNELANNLVYWNPFYKSFYKTVTGNQTIKLRMRYYTPGAFTMTGTFHNGDLFGSPSGYENDAFFFARRIR